MGPGAGGPKILNQPVPRRFGRASGSPSRICTREGRRLWGPRCARASIHGPDAAAGQRQVGNGAGTTGTRGDGWGAAGQEDRGATIIVGPLNLGGSLERIADPVAMAELAVDKQATVLLMPVGARRELMQLEDDVWTKVNIEFYRDAQDGCSRCWSSRRPRAEQELRAAFALPWTIGEFVYIAYVVDIHERRVNRENGRDPR